MVGQRRGAPPTLAVILMDDALCGRLWEGLPPPMDHQQANQLTTHPVSLGINPQTWWESISGSPLHKSISPFSEAASHFGRGTAPSQLPTLRTESTFLPPPAANPILSPFGQEFPLSIKIKSFTQFLQVQRRNLSPRLIWKRMN